MGQRHIGVQPHVAHGKIKSAIKKHLAHRIDAHFSGHQEGAKKHWHKDYEFDHHGAAVFVAAKAQEFSGKAFDHCTNLN